MFPRCHPNYTSHINGKFLKLVIIKDTVVQRTEFRYEKKVISQIAPHLLTKTGFDQMMAYKFQVSSYSPLVPKKIEAYMLEL
jgi:hypothetical protein